jgi:hypothetical protein
MACSRAKFTFYRPNRADVSLPYKCSSAHVFTKTSAHRGIQRLFITFYLYAIHSPARSHVPSTDCLQFYTILYTIIIVFPPHFLYLLSLCKSWDLSDILITTSINLTFIGKGVFVWLLLIFKPQVFGLMLENRLPKTVTNIWKCICLWLYVLRIVFDV